MDYNKISEIALAEMQSRVSMKDKVDLDELQKSISIAIAKAFEEYDNQKT